MKGKMTETAGAVHTHAQGNLINNNKSIKKYALDIIYKNDR